MAKFTGTDGADSYTLKEGKRDVVSMLGGDDAVYLSSASLHTEDRIDAGKGDDRAIFQNGGFYNLGHKHFTGFESLVMSGTGDFEIYLDDSVAAARTTLTIDASDILVDKTDPSRLFVDGAFERDASLLFHGSAGDDALIGGFLGDTFHGGAGNDVMTGAEGADTFVFTGSAKGDNWGKDRITDFRPGEDHLVIQSDLVSSFDDLLLDRTREGVAIRFADSKSTITLLGVLPRDLHASDLTFEPLSAHPAGHHALSVPHELPLA